MKSRCYLKILAPLGVGLFAAALWAGDSAISDGQNAENVAGQMDSGGAADYTGGTPFDSQALTGVYRPYDVTVDTTSHRLFVVDTNSSRILQFDLDSSNNLVDLSPDHVLGQTNFYGNKQTVSQSRLYTSYGATYDGASNRLFVADQGAHRIIVYDVASITDGENAVNVLGQANFTSLTAATTVNGMRYPNYCALGTGNRLYVSDTYNHRILVFDIASITDGENAINVLGQADFTSGTAATAQNRLYYPRAMKEDGSGRLFVGDSFGSRVLVFDVNTITDGENAVNVLGQTNFTSSTAGTAQNRLANAFGIDYSSSTQRLFVGDGWNNRIMVFDVASVTDGENATNVLGQSTFVGSSAGSTQSGMNYPVGLSFEPSTSRLFVADSYNHRVGVYDVAAITNGENAINVLGQADFTTATGATQANRMNYPRGVEQDGASRLFVADYGNSRVLVFDVASITNGENAINVLGQTSFTTATTGQTQSTINSPAGVTVDNRNRLYVSDYGNHRVFVFDVASITDGENAINVFGQTNFTARSSATSQKGLYYPRGLAFEPVMNRLYISDFNNNRVVVQSVGPVSPSTSTLTGDPATATGNVNLTWASAGDDGAFNALTGSYRIQYATYTTTWSTSSTPTNATTLTISTTNVVPGVVQSTTIAGLTGGTTYYFALFTGDEVPNWSGVSNTVSVIPPEGITMTETVVQPGWIGQGETQRVVGTAKVVADPDAGVTVSSVAVRETGAYTADGNLTNVEVWVSSSGYIDANALRLENTAKAFSSDEVVFTQDVAVSTTPIYFIVRCDVGGAATEGTFDISLQVYTTAPVANNPLAFSQTTDVVAPPSGSVSGLSATPSGTLLRVSLSWDAMTGADSYTIYRATHSGVTTTDFLLTMTNGTSFVDDYLVPNQAMYYTVIGTNRAGASGASAAANATTVDIPALTTGNIYLRAGILGDSGDGNIAYAGSVNPIASFVDGRGNVYIADSSNHRIRFIPKKGGTYFGQAMVANLIYTIAGNGIGSYVADNVAATSTPIYSPYGVSVDVAGNVYIAARSNNRVRFIPVSGGTYFGQSMTANYIYTIAGNGSVGYGADDVAATATSLDSPHGVDVDFNGNLYIADYWNHRIRFVPQTSGTYFGQTMGANKIYTIAGNGTGGYVADNVAATSTQIYYPYDVTVDAGGNVYIADRNNNRVRFVPVSDGTYFGQSMSANFIYTIAGNGTGGYVTDSVAATSTQVNAPSGVGLDASGNLYIADANNHRLRFVAKTDGTYFGQSMTANSIYTIAGNGTSGYLADNVAATSTRINTPAGVNVDSGGNIYLADTANNRLRFVPKTSGTYFGQSMLANSLYSIVGNSAGGYVADDLAANATKIYIPTSVSVDAVGNISIADNWNQRVRFIPKTGGTYFGQSMAANSIYTVAGNGTTGFVADGVAANTAPMNSLNSVSLDRDGNLYIADRNNYRVRFVPKTSGTYFAQSMTANFIYTIAGNGSAGYLLDDVAATSTRLNAPSGVHVDGGGNIYIADLNNHRIRFIPMTGGTYFGQAMTADYIYTIAGNGIGGYVADNVAATSTQINGPYGVCVDVEGNVIIADSINQRVRFVPKTGGTYFGQSMTANFIYTIAGNGTSGYLADNVAATGTRLNNPSSVSVDAGGNVYIADRTNNRIRFVPKTEGTYFGQSMTANFIYTIGGTGSSTYNGENASATTKNINNPWGVFAGGDHMVYVADSSNNKIRMIAGEDFIAPSTSTVTAIPGGAEGTIDLSWASAGDDRVNLGSLTGNYRIQYATFTAAWSAGSTPAGATTLTISTTNVVPGVAQSTRIVGLPGGATHYFALFTGDEIPNWSDVSNTASALANETDLVAPSTSTLAASPSAQIGGIDLSWLSAGDDGGAGNLVLGEYRVQYTTSTVAWSTSTTPSYATTVTISTTNVVPGSAQNLTVTGLVPTKSYSIVLWTKDNMGNWSEISNTTSAVVSAEGVAPSSSTLVAETGLAAGAIGLSWSSAGADGIYNNLTGNYRIQYATYTVSWSTSSTPTDAYTSTLTATSVAPGDLVSTTIVVSPTTPQTWYFVLWTVDEAGNWSTISSAVSASPPPVIAGYGVGPFDVTSVGGGLSQGGAAWGDYDKDGDLDVVVSGTDGTNNQIRVYKSNGDGTFNSTAVDVAAVNSGLKDGDVAFGDYDNDGDIDAMASGTDGSNRQLRVYKNNGDATFNTTAVEVPGASNIGLSSGTVAWGDFDNDGDLDVLANGYDGSNNQLRVHTNKGDGTFVSTVIDVAGSNNGLRQGGVAWADFDRDGDLDVLVSGTDGTNRQLRVYKNNGDGTFNSTAIEVAGLNSGLSDGRVAWGDFDTDGDLDVLVSGTDGTNFQLRTYTNNGDGTFNATPVNVAGTNGGLSYSAVAVGDYNVDGNIDILTAGRAAGLVGYWKFDENTGSLAADASGNGNTGTLTNSPTWITAHHGAGLSFNGTTDFVDAGNTASLDINGAVDLTLSAWIKKPGGSWDGSNGKYHSIIYKGSVFAQGYGIEIYERITNRELKLQFIYNGGAGVANWDIGSGGPVSFAADWTHIVAVKQGTNTRLYSNGVQVGNNSGQAASITSTTDILCIGKPSGSYHANDLGFPGYIDDVRVYRRALSAGEVTGLYQASKGAIGALRIHKGNGDGTFNSTAVEVDNGLEKGHVAWGDADEDGDLDLLTAGSDGTNPNLSVYLSTQSLTASNTAPSASGGHSASISFNASSVSVASFTWTAGTDSGTGATSENGLSYDIRISTKSDFSLLVAPGEEGATPRLGSYLKPPKIFNSNTSYGVLLKSTEPWNTPSTAGFGLRTDTTYYYQVKTIDAGLATSGWSASGTLNAGVGPSTSTLVASGAVVSGEVSLSWSSAGDDGMIGNLTGAYRIQYATYTATWDTGSTPTDATTLTISTTNVTPGVVQSTTIAGLTSGMTYYFALFTGDEVPNWSGVSNTASTVGQSSVTVTEMGSQPGWIGRGETQRILGTAQVVSDATLGVTVSSVSVQSSGYSADGNLTNVEVWVSSSGYIDATAVRLDGTSKSFSGDVVAFDQDVTVSTTPLYFITRADVAAGATEGTFDIALQVHTTAVTVNNPVAFTNATDVVAPPSGAPSGLSATASDSLLRVSLSWAAGTGVDSYSIYRATYSGVTTTDFLLGVTNGTSFNDDSIPPAQQMYYTVVGTNRAGASSASSAANATSVDVAALTTSNIYLRAGVPNGFSSGFNAFSELIGQVYNTIVDNAGNLYIADTTNHRIRFVPQVTGTHFGQSMVANSIYDIAGSGTMGYTGDNILATTAQMNTPTGVSVDAEGNVYISDRGNNRIRFIPKTSATYFGQSMTANYIYTIAGNGTRGYVADNVAATNTQIAGPFGVSVDETGNVYIPDYNTHRIRFVAKTSGTNFGQSMLANYIYTIAGNGTGGYVADNVAAFGAQINNPTGVKADVAGNVYIADFNNNRVRFIPRSGGTHFGQSMTANYIYTIAGNGVGGYVADNVAATSTRLYLPQEVSVDTAGNVYIADKSNHRVRVVAKTNGTYYGQSMTANYIYSIGTGFLNPRGVNVDGGGQVYIADSDHYRVQFIPKNDGTYFGRALTANTAQTIVGNGSSVATADGVMATTARIDLGIGTSGVSVDASGNLYIADSNNSRIRFLPKTGGAYFGQTMTANFLYTIAGNGTGGYVADNVAATNTPINYPNGVAVDGEGNVYIADTNNKRIRFVPKTGGTYFGQSMTANYIYTIAGNGGGGYQGDNVAATSTRLKDPAGVCLDAAGNIYIADSGNDRVRFIPKAGGTYFGQAMTANYIYTIAGNGTGGYVADNVEATSTQIYVPSGVSVDPEGNLTIADYANHRIRFVPKTGGGYFGQTMTANFIYTIAGNGTGGYVADNVAATGTQIYSPIGVSVDAGGNLAIADNYNHRIRFVPKRGGTYFGQVMTGNFIYSIGGDGETPYDGENTVATGKNIYQPSGVFFGQDHRVYLTDTNNKVRMIAGEDFIQPSTSTMAVTTGVEQATLSWASAGDDNVNLGNLTGTYRIQYATFTAAWSTASTPTDATTVTIATTNVVPGSAQSYVVTGLTAGPTYYFVLWSADEVPNWSDISNTTSTIVLAPIRSVTITAGNVLALGSVMMGDQVVGGTGTVVMNDGTLLNTYVLRASTLTVGSPWQVMASTPAGPDQLVFYGVFDGASEPVLGNFDVDDVVGPDDRVSTSAQFSVAGSTTGASVPAGESRTLWIRLDAPTTTTTMAGQTMRIEITAQPP